MITPKLRFSEFKSNWQNVKLSHLIKSLDAGISVNSEDITPNENEYSVLKTSCVTTGYFDGNERKRVKDETEISRLKEPLLDNSILISRMNTPLLVGMNAYVKKAPKNTFLPDRLWQVKINEITANTLWLAFYLGSKKGLGQIQDLATGTSNSMKNITKSDVLQQELFAPSLPEQTKIAEFLSVVDDKISQLSRQLELLNQYKKGVMQKIFSQEIRFKNDNGEDFGEWEYLQLGELIKESKAVSKKQDEFDVLTSSRRGLIKQSEYFEGSRLIDRDNVGFNIIKPHEITYRSRSDDGLFYFNFNNLGITGIISTYYPVFSFKNSNNKFVAEYLNFNKADFLKYAVGTSQLVLSLNALRTVKLRIPSKPEQEKIAAFLTAIDERIDHTTTQLTHTKHWKKGLLQQMFI